MEWRLCQYEGAYDEFISSAGTDVELKARVDQRLARLETQGNQSTEPVSKFVEDGIFECKASSAKHHARLFFCFQPHAKIVILLGVLKDQRKLRRADIDEAKRRRDRLGDQIGTLTSVT